MKQGSPKQQNSNGLDELKKLSGYNFDQYLLNSSSKASTTADEIVSADALLEAEIFKMCNAYRDLALDTLVDYDEEGQPWGPPPENLPKKMVPEVRGKILTLFGEGKLNGSKVDFDIEGKPLNKNRLVEVKPDFRQREIIDKFTGILNTAWRNFKKSLNKTVYSWIPELKDQRFDFEWGGIPYLTQRDYEMLKREFNSAKRSTDYPDKADLEYAYLQLISYFRTQLIYLTLVNESFESASGQIENLFEEYSSKGKDFRDRSNRLTLQLTSPEAIKESPFYEFSKTLKRDQRLLKIEHPKFSALKKEMEPLIKDGKRVLILCDHLETANVLNYRMNTEWKIRSGVIHGSKKEKKKNQMRQQYLVGQLNDGRYQVLIATPTVEHGINLPEFDAIICYSPSRSLDVELKAIARLKKGGEIITLAALHEEGKYFKNKKEKKKLRFPKDEAAKMPTKKKRRNDSQLELFGK